MSDKLKICLITGSLGIGGAEKQVFYLCQALKYKQIDLTVISLTKDEFYEAPIKKLGVNFISLATIKNPLLKLYKIYKVVKQNEIDIIQSSHTFTNLYAGLIGKLTKALSIGALRSSYEYSKRFNGRFTKPMLRFPDLIFFNSQAAIDETLSLKVINQDAAQLLHNVIESKKYLLESRLNNNGIINLIYVGKVQHSKGIDSLLRAFKTIHLKHSNTQLTIVGDGKDLDFYKNLSDELKISQVTEFVGNSNKVVEYLHQSDVFIFPSLSEGFPNVVIEAMAAGLPVISTPAGDINLIVKEEESGFIVNFNSPEEIAEKVNYLIMNPELIIKLGKAGQSIVLNKFDSKHLPKNILNLYIKAAAYKQKKKLQKKIKLYIQ